MMEEALGQQSASFFCPLESGSSVMHQLDIFADSLPLQHANALIAALARFDRALSRQALQALIAIAPQHAGLAHFRVLCEFVESWPNACDGTSHSEKSIVAAGQMLTERIVPAAAVMGEARLTLLRQCWSDLAQWSAAASIGPETPEWFAAELHLRAGRPADAVRAAQGIAGADRRAAVQRWLGLGHFRCGDKAASRTAALRYAWLAPQRFEALLEEMNDSALARDWRTFQADLDDLDATWFPAWCAHEKKGGATITDNLPPGEGPMAYHLIVGLAIREHAGLGPAVYEDRARLKRLDESFFAFYMKHRSDPILNRR
jgi:hypothetical protein